MKTHCSGFWTCFDPLLAILLGLGGRACKGEPDKKDKKSENWPENHQKWKNSNLLSKCADFTQEFWKKFFSQFWTRFDPLLAILLVLGGRAYIGELGKKYLEKSEKSRKRFFFKYAEFSGDDGKHIFSWFFDRFDPLLATLLKRAHFLPTEPKILREISESKKKRTPPPLKKYRLAPKRYQLGLPVLD